MIQKLTLVLLLLSFSVHAITDTITIQQGLNGYFGGSDTYIGQGLPSNSTNQGASEDLNVGRC